MRLAGDAGGPSVRNVPHQNNYTVRFSIAGAVQTTARKWPVDRVRRLATVRTTSILRTVIVWLRRLREAVVQIDLDAQLLRLISQLLDQLGIGQTRCELRQRRQRLGSRPSERARAASIF